MRRRTRRRRASPCRTTPRRTWASPCRTRRSRRRSSLPEWWCSFRLRKKIHASSLESLEEVRDARLAARLVRGRGGVAVVHLVPAQLRHALDLLGVRGHEDLLEEAGVHGGVAAPP